MAVSINAPSLVETYLKAKGVKTIIQRTDGRVALTMSDGCSYIAWGSPMDSLEELFEKHEYDHKIREVTG